MLKPGTVRYSLVQKDPVRNSQVKPGTVRYIQGYRKSRYSQVQQDLAKFSKVHPDSAIVIFVVQPEFLMAFLAQFYYVFFSRRAALECQMSYNLHHTSSSKLQRLVQIAEASISNVLPTGSIIGSSGFFGPVALPVA